VCVNGRGVRIRMGRAGWWVLVEKGGVGGREACGGGGVYGGKDRNNLPK